MKHQFQWTGQWADGKEVDLSKIPCSSVWGISDCWPCYILPSMKENLTDALSIALTGRTEVLVSSRSFNGLFSSLDPKDISVSWFQELDKSPDL